MNISTDMIRWTLDESGEWLKLRVKNPQAILEQIKEGKTYDVEIKLHREKRSLDANGYFWLLLGKVAQHYSLPNDDVYREYIRQHGPFEVIPVREDISDRWADIWGANGIGFFVEDLGASRKLQGYHNFRCYYGSHVYNTKEMSVLIDAVVADCKAIGIETMPPDKLKALIGEWDAQRDKGESDTAEC